MLDRATFRMRAGEGLQLAQLLDSSVRQRRDAGARYAGAKFCASVLTTGVYVPKQPVSCLCCLDLFLTGFLWL